jgi:hypothetical protein
MLENMLLIHVCISLNIHLTFIHSLPMSIDITAAPSASRMSTVESVMSPTIKAKLVEIRIFAAPGDPRENDEIFIQNLPIEMRVARANL